MSNSQSSSPRQLSIPDPAVRILNDGEGTGKTETKSAAQAATDMQKLMLRMKGEAMAADGRAVNYATLLKSALFVQYKTQAAALKTVDLSRLTEAERMAFFINIYNSLTIHGLVEAKDLPKSVLDIRQFWKITAYNICGHVYSLDIIEHGILRGNRPHPAAIHPPFEKTDPRLPLAMKKCDPRIHFALVCGAKSCPAINVYKSDNLETALDAATRSFCAQEIKIQPAAKVICVSKIFDWYQRDFGANDVEAIKWALPYVDEKKSRDLQMMLAALESSGMVDIIYSPYDWTLNNVT